MVRLAPGLLIAILLIGATQAQAAVPGQYIAKIYTEALGRAPDANEWGIWVNWFAANGCSRQTLHAMGYVVQTGSEYNGIGYDNYERTLTAYRAVFSLEPDPSGYTGWVNWLNSGGSYQSMLDTFYNTSVFNGLVPEICAGGKYGGSGEGWGGSALTNATIPVKAGSGFVGNQAQLQAALNTFSAQGGGVFFLRQRLVVPLTSQLVVPANVQLATEGWPTPRQYAKQARLVRTTQFLGSPVRLQRESTWGVSQLLRLWVSGQKHLWPNGHGDAVWYSGMNIDHTGGDYASVDGVKSDTPYSWSNLRIDGDSLNPAALCRHVTIANNLLTSYTSRHTGYLTGYTDGITLACEDANVYNNHIVDATDEGIAIFSTYPRQRSHVHNNLVIAAGLSMAWGIGLTPNYGLPSPWFGGTLVELNTVMSSPTQHVDTAYHLGIKPLDGNSEVGISGSGEPVRFENNSFPQGYYRAGLIIDGMRDVNVTGNSLAGSSSLPAWPCLMGHLFAHTPTDASGTIQPYVAASMHDCLQVGL